MPMISPRTVPPSGPRKTSESAPTIWAGAELPHTPSAITAAAQRDIIAK